MRKGACITLVVASAAMLGAGICTRGARADRGVDVQGHDLSILQDGTALQRQQRGPQCAAQSPVARGASDIIAVAAVARHPSGPDNAGQDRDTARVRFASLEATPVRRMRALSIDEALEPADAAPAHGDGLTQQQSGSAGVARPAFVEEDGSDAARTSIRFDRVVININLAGFGS